MPVREEILPYDEFAARFRGARLFEIGERRVVYLAERDGHPCLAVGTGDGLMTLTVFTDERERAVHLAGGCGFPQGGAVAHGR
jgi:hypothetical protein